MRVHSAECAVDNSLFKLLRENPMCYCAHAGINLQQDPYFWHTFRSQGLVSLKQKAAAWGGVKNLLQLYTVWQERLHHLVISRFESELQLNSHLHNLHLLPPSQRWQ